MIMLFFMIYWILVALWVYKNALKPKLNATIWGIIVLFTNLAGLFVYLIYKQGSQTCKNCDTAINNKDSYYKNCGSEITRK